MLFGGQQFDFILLLPLKLSETISYEYYYGSSFHEQVAHIGEIKVSEGCDYPPFPYNSKRMVKVSILPYGI